MNYLLDTNVISELVSSKPNLNVMTWFEQIPMQAFFLSVLRLGEIRKAIEKVKDNKHKKKLLIWLEHDLIDLFGERLLTISAPIADRWGRLQYQVTRTFPAIDSLICRSLDFI